MIRVICIICCILSCRPAVLSTSATQCIQDKEGIFLSEKQVTKAQFLIEAAAMHDVDTEVITTGSITFDDAKVSHVFSPVSGEVKHINVDLGSSVYRGQVLAVIESPDLGQFSSDLDKAKADFLTAQRDYERQKSLYEAHAAAKRDFEIATATYEKAKAEMKRTEEKVNMLHSATTNTDNTSQHYKLTAPIDGEVIARFVNPGMQIQGQYAGGNPAVELFTIGSLNNVWVLGDIFEEDVAQIKKDQPVEIKVVAYPNDVFHGHVDWFSSVINPNTRTAPIRCSINNTSHRLKPAMYATVKVLTHGQQALSIKRNSIFHIKDKTIVFVQGEKTAKQSETGWYFIRRNVEVDETVEGDFVPVHSGLKVGQKVIASGGILLTDF